jgi:hypothetical protein
MTLQVTSAREPWWTSQAFPCRHSTVEDEQYERVLLLGNNKYIVDSKFAKKNNWSTNMKVNFYYFHISLSLLEHSFQSHTNKQRKWPSGSVMSKLNLRVCFPVSQWIDTRIAQSVTWLHTVLTVWDQFPARAGPILFITTFSQLWGSYLWDKPAGSWSWAPISF